ncbi:MAG: hypothetical protein V3T09_08370 [bacterium]
MNNKKFLIELAKTGIIGIACKNIGITREVYRKEIKKNPNFKAKCDDAVDDSVDEIEYELRHRALHGTESNVLHQGNVVYCRDENGQVLLDKDLQAIPFKQVKSSDKSLEVYLKYNRKKYRDSGNEDESDIPNNINVKFV